jgi:hypothetical protein
MPWIDQVMVVPRVRRAHLRPSSSGGSSDLSDPASLKPIMFGFSLPRSSDIAELMALVRDKAGWSDGAFVLAEVYRHRTTRHLDPKEQLSALRDDDLIVAYERSVSVVVARQGQGQGQGQAVEEGQSQGQPKGETQGEGPLADNMEEDSDLEEGDGEEEREAEAQLPQEVWPGSLEGLVEGSRVDALDYQHQWFVGSVVRVDPRGPTGRRVMVHFDRFSPKWDEWYDEEAFKAGRIAPAYTHTTRRRKLVELEVRGWAS